MPLYKKISELTEELTSPDGTEIVHVVTNPNGDPVSKFATLETLGTVGGTANAHIDLGTITTSQGVTNELQMDLSLANSFEVVVSNCHVAPAIINPPASGTPWEARLKLTLLSFGYLDVPDYMTPEVEDMPTTPGTYYITFRGNEGSTLSEELISDPGLNDVEHWKDGEGGPPSGVTFTPEGAVCANNSNLYNYGNPYGTGFYLPIIGTQYRWEIECTAYTSGDIGLYGGGRYWDQGIVNAVENVSGYVTATAITPWYSINGDYRVDDFYGTISLWSMKTYEAPCTYSYVEANPFVTTYDRPWELCTQTVVSSPTSAVGWDGFNTTWVYDEYMLEWSGIYSTSSSADMHLQVLDGTSWRGSTNQFNTVVMINNIPYSDVISAAQAKLPSSTSSTTGRGVVWFSDLSDTTKAKMFHSISGGGSSPTIFNPADIYSSFGFYKSTNALQGVRFLVSGVNIAGGTFTLYGRNR